MPPVVDVVVASATTADDCDCCNVVYEICECEVVPAQWKMTVDSTFAAGIDGTRCYNASVPPDPPGTVDAFWQCSPQEVIFDVDPALLPFGEWNGPIAALCDPNTLPPTATQINLQLDCNSTGDDWTIIGPSVQWNCPKLGFDCLGPNVFTKTFDEHATITWPATITIEPA